jgi:hypothetical protein
MSVTISRLHDVTINLNPPDSPAKWVETFQRSQQTDIMWQCHIPEACNLKMRMLMLCSHVAFHPENVTFTSTFSLLPWWWTQQRYQNYTIFVSFWQGEFSSRMLGADHFYSNCGSWVVDKENIHSAPDTSCTESAPHVQSRPDCQLL